MNVTYRVLEDFSVEIENLRSIKNNEGETEEIKESIKTTFHKDSYIEIEEGSVFVLIINKRTFNYTTGPEEKIVAARHKIDADKNDKILNEIIKEESKEFIEEVDEVEFEVIE